MTLERGPWDEGVSKPAAPEVVGDYKLGTKLGGGSFGDVYQAQHSVIGREVAIKILHLHRCHDAEAVARFIAEARAANQIHHPGIVDIHGFGELPDGRHYCVMELLRGKTLHAVIEERGKLPLSEALPILRGIAGAVDAAHLAGIAHRDLKPENVMVLDDGTIKLIDFGLAKLSAESALTQTGAVLGTPRYMSPEQCRGQRSDVRADLYSFGAVAYHLLTGSPPFLGDALALALHHVNDVPVPPSTRNPELTPAVDDVVGRLLDKTPGRRPRPLATAVEDLARTTPRRRRGRLVAVVAAGVVALGGGVGIAAYTSTRSDAPPPAPPPTPAPAPIDAPTVPVYSATATPIAIDQPRVFAPSFSADAKEISFMNERGLWAFHDGATTLVDAAASFRTQLADGRWLVTRESAETGPGVWVEGKGVPPRKITDGAWAAAAPNGARMVLVRNRVPTLASIDPDGFVPIQAELGDNVGHWSPDGMRGLATSIFLRSPWGIGLTAAVESLGALRPINLDILNGPPGFSGTSYVSHEGVLYCGPGAKTPELKIRDIASDTDQTLLPMPEGTRSCEINTSRDGRRAVVVANFEDQRIGVLDPKTGKIDDAAGDGHPFPIAFADDDHLVAGRYVDGRTDYELQDATVAKTTPAWTLEQIDTHTHAGSKLASCAGELEVVRFRGALAHVVRSTPTTIDFLAPECTRVATWTLPASLLLSRPSCTETRCAIAVRTDTQLELHVFDDKGDRVLGSVPVSGTGATPLVAISPDGANAVIAVQGSLDLHVFSLLAAGKAHDLVIPPSHTNAWMPISAIGSIVWGRPDALYVSAVGVDKIRYGVFRIGLDGKRSPVWKSETEWARLSGASPGGKLGIVRVAVTSKPFLVEITPK